MAQSLAAEVPVELFDLVLSFYTAQDLHDAQLERNYVKTEKRQIAQIALVCRAWARACQPKLFEELELRSREDLKQLLSLMARPKTLIRDYILFIKFEDGMQQVQTIVLDFSPYRTTLPLQELVDYVDWTTLDEQLWLLRNTGTVLFVFESPMELRSINESIIQPKLPRLSCSARLKYAISNEKAYSERRWLECTPETIDQVKMYVDLESMQKPSAVYCVRT
ncbi:hypothetical protein EIP86_006116 [Pleurotus ostreatoroseus]|nr:hypothetical protein EIP86_006116 [Pleurotus ostreatoroseus]